VLFARSAADKVAFHESAACFASLAAFSGEGEQLTLIDMAAIAAHKRSTPHELQTLRPE
jgi:hypothetical protein